MITLARVLAFVSVATSILLQLRVKLSSGTIFIRAMELLIGSLAPYVAARGALGAILGSLLRDPLTIVTGAIGAGPLRNVDGAMRLSGATIVESKHSSFGISSSTLALRSLDEVPRTVNII